MDYLQERLLIKRMDENKVVQISSNESCQKSGERVEQMTPFLLEWFGNQARVLPWRTEPKPYYVWVSEIMLQQTRVEAVKPYFSRFIRTLPDIQALAECEEKLLLKLWEGLGYYNRVRNLQKAAQAVMELYQGELPADYEALLKLPGIGSYTAGAIASIAYQIPVPAVDGNVLRVMARLTESYEDIAKASVKKQTEELLKKHMPKKEARAFNQAMMEIGAMICLPNGEPKCTECPIGQFCLAFQHKTVMELPVKTKKKARRIEEITVFIIHSEEWEESKGFGSYSFRRSKIMLHKRPNRGLLAGMYEFPNVSKKLDLKEAQEVLESWGVKIKSILPIEEAKHIFSHVEWHMKGYLVERLAEDLKETGMPVQSGMVAENGMFFADGSVRQKKEANKREVDKKEAYEKETDSEKIQIEKEHIFEWFTIEKVQNEIAIPSAFAAYTKYMAKIKEDNF